MNNQPIFQFPLHPRAYNNAQKVLCGELHKLRTYSSFSRKDKKEVWREFRRQILYEDLQELNLMWFLNQGT